MRKNTVKQLTLSKNLIDESKLPIFFKFLNGSCLKERDLQHILFLIGFLQGDCPKELSSRSFLFEGEPGIGKTYLVEELFKIVKLPIHYVGTDDFKHPLRIKYDSLKELVVAFRKKPLGIVYLDDLQYVLKYIEDTPEIDYEYKQDFMELLNLIKRNFNSILIATANDVILDSPMRDRIDVGIKIGLPNSINKANYLEKNYGKHLDSKLIRYFAENTIGFNYRELSELVRLSYRLGEGKFSINSTKIAINMYTPSSLSGIKMIRDVDISLKDISGKEQIKEKIQHAINFVNNRNKLDKMGVKRTNLLLFHGPPGTGKTKMAKAIAGEVGWPFMFLEASKFECHPASVIENAIDLVCRFKRCILFIDDADYILGRSMMGEDESLQGALLSALDSVKKPIEGIIILAMNNIHRFGSALKDRAVSIKFENPTIEERIIFFKERQKNSKLDIDSLYLIKQTEGLSYRELEKIWDDIIFHFLDKKKIVADDIANIIRMYKTEERCGEVPWMIG